MSPAGSLLIGLTAIVGVLMGIIAFALLQFLKTARDVNRDLKSSGAETAFMATALEDAVSRLRDQERVMSARAEASERLSGEIIANLTSGLLVVGEAREVRTLNPAGRRLLGLPDADWTGKLAEVLATAPPLAEVVEECLATGRPIVRRAISMNTSGAAHLGVTVSPMRDDATGATHGAVCLFSDLSAVVELEEQLRLQDSLARLGELTAGLAHEFRNGLATIHGYARLIDPARVSDEYRPYVQGIRAETDSLREIVTNFLNFARPTRLALGPVDMRAIAERAADDVRADVQAAGGSIEVLGDFVRVNGDEVLLRQAFTNLCRNAVEACAAIHRAPRITIEGAIDAAAHMLKIAVQDNGPGIDPALGDRVFQPFVTGRSHGTGLGLALVQKIIVTHQGRIGAARSPEGGASFQIAIPLEARSASTSVT